MKTVKNSHGIAIYGIIFVWLAVLTLLEVGAVSLGLPKQALVIFILATALAKAALIIFYFMHLRSEAWKMWFLPAIPVLFAILFIAALFPDIVFHLTFKM